MADAPADRRLLTGGERLRTSVEPPPPPPRGGGQKFHPRTPEGSLSILRPQVEKVCSAANHLPDHLRGSRLYVDFCLLPNYLAPSYFPYPLLHHISADAVGSRAAKGILVTKTKSEPAITRRLILAIDNRGLDNLQGLLNEPRITRSTEQAFKEIRKIDEIDIASSERVVCNLPDGTHTITWEAVLHPGGTTTLGHPIPLDENTIGLWFDLVEDLGGTSHRDYLRRVGGLTFVPVELSIARAAEAAQFNPLRAIRPMPQIRPRPIFGTRSSRKVLPPATLAPTHTQPSVGVIGGGLDCRPSSGFHSKPAIALTTEVENPNEVNHGTGVANATAYGLLYPVDGAKSPPCPIDSYRVLPASSAAADLHSYTVLDEIIKTVASGGYSLVNLSLGPEFAVEDATEPNRWTSELDQLAWEKDVLFVVAAGNDGDKDRATGLHRVQIPADMANGLSVGACNVPPPDKPWKRARYSSMGPGRHGNRIQPLGVQFGGTADQPFPVILGDGSVVDTWGTSFATPLVTHALARVSPRLNHPNPNVWRALAVHFAERPRAYHQSVNEIGHGRLPLDFSPHFDCDANEVHVLYVDSIERGEIASYRLPVPAHLKLPIKIDVTLSYLTPVQPTEATEYTQAALELGPSTPSPSP